MAKQKQEEKKTVGEGQPTKKLAIKKQKKIVIDKILKQFSCQKKKNKIVSQKFYFCACICTYIS